MSQSFISLDAMDHDILLCLIRGEDINEAAVSVNISRAAINGRLLRMKRITECATVYQLVATEVVNLMESTVPVREKALKVRTATA